MAFTDNKLSDPAVPGAFLGAGSEFMLSRVHDFIDGPIAQQDTSMGLDYQQWEAYVKDSNVWLSAGNQEPSILLPNPGNSITDISIAFSQNADLHYVWVDSGVARFRYYDTLAGSMQTMTLPEGTRTPRITLDDKRPAQYDRSDIILSYLDAEGRLYFRMQRDRYGVEYLLDEGPHKSLERLYMNERYRLQWLLTRMDTIRVEGV